MRKLSVVLAAWALAVSVLGTSALWVAGGTGTAAAAVAPAGAAAAAAAGAGAPFVEGEILVGFDPGARGADRAAAYRAVGASPAAPLSPLSRAERLVLGQGTSTARAMQVLQGLPGVRYVEPNYLLQRTATSNDPYCTGNNLWGMYGDTTTPANTFGSHAGEAWANGYTGSSSIVIGVIDEGIQVQHPDLAANIWTNPGEIAGNGIDDDGNSYIDDVNGYDFVSNDGTVYDGTGDDHATHVAGTIGGAGGNGIGVAGVNWDVTMISAKFLGSSGGTTADAVRAVDYLNDLKTRYNLNLVASSNSWGGGGFSQSLLDAINRGGDRGILFIAAAGNSSSNNDAGAYYPSNYQCTNNNTRGWDCVVSVAAIQSNGALAGFSSYGATTVDIGAPGVSINSTVPDSTYASYNGTSMATPHVSGAAALCASADPTISAQDLRSAIVESTMPTQSLAGRAVNSGRLDVTALLKRCVAPTAAMSGTPTGLGATSLSTSSIRIAWTDAVTAETGYEIQRATSAGGGACGTFSTVAKVAANATQFWSAGLGASTEYCFRVRATQGASTTAWSTTATATTSTAPTPYACTATTAAWVDPRVGGTRYSLTDDSAASVTLPWAFSFYGGAASTAVQISSNGYVRFGAGSATGYANTVIPDAGDPNAYAAPWWDDLNPGAGGEVWAATIGTAPTRQWVVAWIDVPQYGVAGSALTFEVVLDESTGNITFQYLDTIAGGATYDRGANATAGIEDPTGTYGTAISVNAASLTDGSASRCSRVASPLPPRVTTASLAPASRGVAYNQSLAATGGTTPYTWSIGSGSLPAGLTLDATTGAISGTPASTATTSTVTVSAVDAASPAQRGSRTLTIAVADPIAITPTSLPSMTVGAPYSQQLVATGGTGSYTWSLASGSLPAGLSLNTSTGLISGTPTSGATATFTVRATDQVGRTGDLALSLVQDTPLAIVTSSLAPATRGVVYASSLQATGGATPYTWSVTSGSLPDGLTLNTATGAISGTPSSIATSATFTVGVTDSSAVAQSVTALFSITVTDPVSITTSALPNGTTTVAYATTLAAAGGTGTYTWAVTGGSLPAGLSLNAGTGAISGTPTTAGTSTFTVQATDGAARSASRALSITVVQANLPGAFAKSSPKNNATKVSRTPTLSWATSTNATSYEYCISSTASCPVGGWVSTGTNRSVTLTTRAANTTFWWQVRAVNSQGSTVANSGTWWKFTTAR
jgi:subtilisin family serine protease